MESELRTRAIHDAEAALRGIASDLREDVADPTLLALPLITYGDALRLALDPPPDLRRWMERLPSKSLHAAVESLASEIARWSTPTVRAGAALDDLLSTVVRRRDEMESVLTAVRRICIARSIDIAEIASMDTLETALASKDRELAELLTRSELVAMLGLRAAFGISWAALFREEPVDAAAEDDAWPKGLDAASPSNEIVTRYVTRGAMSRYVEGAAAANADFAEELEGSIETLLELRETVGFAARLWMRRRSASATPAAPAKVAAVSIAAIPVNALAASTSVDTKRATNEVLLGALVPLDAEARLIVSATDVTLDVFPGTKALRSVSFGAATVSSATASGEWRVVAAHESGPQRLEVVAEDGTKFSEEVMLTEADDAQ
jgi:hypothetical protein